MNKNIFSFVLSIVLFVCTPTALLFAQEGEFRQVNIGPNPSGCSGFTEGGLSGVVDCIIVYINMAIGVIMGLAILYIIWGAFTMIRDEEKRDEGKKIVMYGIIGVFIMISIWGFVNILNTTFKLDQGPVTPTPFRRL